MNAERLNAVARVLRKELESRNIVGQMEALVNACQQLAQNPGNTSIQLNFASARTNCLTAVTDTPSDSFSPAWRQILIEVGGENFFGKRLKEQVQTILAENQSTLSVAHQKLNEILGRVRAFQETLTRLTDAFNQFNLGAEILSPGEAEIALLIPRNAVDNELTQFVAELGKLRFVLSTFAEVATGRTENLEIRTISSSSLMVSLGAGLIFAGMVAEVVNRIVGAYQRILEVKKVGLEIERLQMPDDMVEKAKEYANNLMKQEIEKLTEEIMSRKGESKTDGRNKELTNSVRISLDMIANRIDRGFNIEVRFEPPAKSEEPAEASAMQAIREASANMQYMKLEGQPILALPENSEAVAEDTKKSEAAQSSVNRRPRRRIDLQSEGR